MYQLPAFTPCLNLDLFIARKYILVCPSPSASKNAVPSVGLSRSKFLNWEYTAFVGELPTVAPVCLAEPDPFKCPYAIENCVSAVVEDAGFALYSSHWYSPAALATWADAVWKAVKLATFPVNAVDVTPWTTLPIIISSDANVVYAISYLLV